MAEGKSVNFIKMPSKTSITEKNFLINTVRNAFELHGEDRNANAKHIYETIK